MRKLKALGQGATAARSMPQPARCSGALCNNGAAAPAPAARAHDGGGRYAQVLAELERDASKRELVARVQGKSATEATAQFPARPKRVEFRSGGMSFLQDGDCELMEQMRDRVFGPLGVKVIDSSVHCSPRQVWLGAIRMTVDVLEPLPAA